MFTGVDDDRVRITRAFAEMLMTDEELAGRATWARLDDGLDDWLGAR